MHFKITYNDDISLTGFVGKDCTLYWSAIGVATLLKIPDIACFKKKYKIETVANIALRYWKKNLSKCILLQPVINHFDMINLLRKNSDQVGNFYKLLCHYNFFIFEENGTKFPRKLSVCQKEKTGAEKFSSWLYHFTNRITNISPVLKRGKAIHEPLTLPSTSISSPSHQPSATGHETIGSFCCASVSTPASPDHLPSASLIHQAPASPDYPPPASPDDPPPASPDYPPPTSPDYPPPTSPDHQPPTTSVQQSPACASPVCKFPKSTTINESPEFTHSYEPPHCYFDASRYHSDFQQPISPNYTPASSVFEPRYTSEFPQYASTSPVLGPRYTSEFPQYASTSPVLGPRYTFEIPQYTPTFPVHGPRYTSEFPQYTPTSRMYTPQAYEPFSRNSAFQPYGRPDDRFIPIGKKYRTETHRPESLLTSLTTDESLGSSSQGTPMPTERPDEKKEPFNRGFSVWWDAVPPSKIYVFYDRKVKHFVPEKED